MRPPYGGFGQFLEPMKILACHDKGCSYQEPTQVPLAEKAKVFEIIQPRELGKLATYLR